MALVNGFRNLEENVDSLKSVGHPWQPLLQLRPQRKLQDLHDTHQQRLGALELGGGAWEMREMIGMGEST